YDASFSSAHGDSACASCHVFGDFDSLAWDLGNPDANVTDDPGPFKSTLFNSIIQQPINPVFHPMKGPMTTQSLRGMLNSGPMHWRGDRTGGRDAPSVQPDSGAFDERAAFEKFQLGFTDLLGRDSAIPDADMDAFTDFILQVRYPPNPNRPLDNVPTPDQATGAQLFGVTNCGIDSAAGSSDILNCNSCHVVDPNANPTTAAPGFFGTSGFSSFDFQTQLFKTPHLRNAYQKLGMFGNPPNPAFIHIGNPFEGDQVRGFGFLHDGDMDTVFRFHHGISFSVDFDGPAHGAGGLLDGPAGEVQRSQIEAFVLAFPTNFAPIVGQQITLAAGSSAAVAARVDLLRQRADAGDCELIAKTTVADAEVGFLYVGHGRFRTDRRAVPPIGDAALRLLARLRPVTFTCVPPGSGERIGVDRDGDGAWDGDERDAHTDPADPTSTP
ncbi:MAG TPA: thrombospondin type 3 repeat-containing protein, partial [Kofleriaceae bacterium]|nr:thrombospondin type 3 repeat-containing protein [Kofleriaceae bacterium]